MKAIVSAGLMGVLFALGLGLGGMTHPEKVLGFLDVMGRWEPSLALVMGGALGVHALFLRWSRRWKAPVLAARFASPPYSRVDGSLVTGAALFGVGWGLVGYCPGPAFVALATGGRDALMFALSMLAGMLLFRFWTRFRAPVGGSPDATN
ncbi:DUF6691 family protein [Stigmatella aurantiaca]|uniref:Conserved uncharacterized protein n=1 Tax=Stigmatella aurantiaca (strain DW4/3-1) TaxID=378806 RepID=E3FJJ9_STIAD|nr:DUF6691 family protein [Stigmatella aurantiaca]ADO71678.1 conserved uncharacterized protein [Stigmatella aurantiaca DW4/3-1]